MTFAVFDGGSSPAEFAGFPGSPVRARRAGTGPGLRAAAPHSHPRGRRARLSSAGLKDVEQALLKGARSHGYASDLWTLDRVGMVIESVTGVTYHRDTPGRSCEPSAGAASAPILERLSKFSACWTANNAVREAKNLETTSSAASLSLI